MFDYIELFYNPNRRHLLWIALRGNFVIRIVYADATRGIRNVDIMTGATGHYQESGATMSSPVGSPAAFLLGLMAIRISIGQVV